MKWTILVVAALFVMAGGAAAGVVALVAMNDGVTQAAESTRLPVAGFDEGVGALEPLEQLGGRAGFEEGSVEKIAEFALAPGRMLRVHVAETNDGQSCLIDEDSQAGAGATCLEGGLFDERPVAFSVSSDGGPERFRELYLVGVAASGIGSVSLAKTDGRTVRLRLSAGNAFVFQSSPDELARDVLPAELRLYGGGGKLVEVVRIPALR